MFLIRSRADDPLLRVYAHPSQNVGSSTTIKQYLVSFRCRVAVPDHQPDLTLDLDKSHNPVEFMYIISCNYIVPLSAAICCKEESYSCHDPKGNLHPMVYGISQTPPQHLFWTKELCPYASVCVFSLRSPCGTVLTGLMHQLLNSSTGLSLATTTLQPYNTSAKRV